MTHSVLIIVEMNSLNLLGHSHFQGVQGTIVDDGEVMANFHIVVPRVRRIVPDDIVVAVALHAFHIVFVVELQSSLISVSQSLKKIILREGFKVYESPRDINILSPPSLGQ